MIERFRRWFDYEQDAHAKVLASFDSVPLEHRSKEEFQQALTLFAHLMAARRLWLYRFGAYPEAPKEFFPKDVTLAQLHEQLSHVNAIWAEHLSRLDDAQIVKTFEYRSLEGDFYRNVIEDILTQLFGHSWYHRGQIAYIVRSLGGTPAATDFVFWTREALSKNE